MLSIGMVVWFDSFKLITRVTGKMKVIANKYSVTIGYQLVNVISVYIMLLVSWRSALTVINMFI